MLAAAECAPNERMAASKWVFLLLATARCAPNIVFILTDDQDHRVAVLLRAGHDARGIVVDAARRAALFAVQPPAWGVVKDR